MHCALQLLLRPLLAAHGPLYFPCCSLVTHRRCDLLDSGRSAVRMGPAAAVAHRVAHLHGLGRLPLHHVPLVSASHSAKNGRILCRPKVPASQCAGLSVWKPEAARWLAVEKHGKGSGKGCEGRQGDEWGGGYSVAGMPRARVSASVCRIPLTERLAE